MCTARGPVQGPSTHGTLVLGHQIEALNSKHWHILLVEAEILGRGMRHLQDDRCKIGISSEPEEWCKLCCAYEASHLHFGMAHLDPTLNHLT
jgi:hypothetical protein